MRPTLTGSRRADLVGFTLLALLIVGLSYRLRVYDHVPKWALERAAPTARP